MKYDFCFQEQQWHAINRLTSAPSWQVIADVGTGKTVVSLTAMRELMRRGLVHRTLVVAPKKVTTDVWVQELAEWEHLQKLTGVRVTGSQSQRATAIRGASDFLLVNFELLPWLEQYLEGDWSRFDLVIVDESSKVKNHSTNTFKLLRRAVRSIGRVWNLTGTPQPNTIGDLWSQYYLLDGGARLGRSKAAFQQQFMIRGRQVADHVYEWSAQEAAQDRIADLVADITIRMSSTLGDIVRIHDIEVDLPAEVRTRYALLEKEAIVELQTTKVVAAHGGAKMMLAHQMSNGQLFVDRAKSEDYEIVHSAKLNALCQLLPTIPGPVIIVYKFRHDLHRIRKEYPGAVHLNDHEGVVALWNAGEIPILLMPSSVSHGLNLQKGGCHMVFYGLHWSREDFDQAIGRLARTGQAAKFVDVYRILCSRTVDEVMRTALHLKGTSQERFRNAFAAYVPSV